MIPFEIASERYLERSIIFLVASGTVIILVSPALSEAEGHCYHCLDFNIFSFFLKFYIKFDYRSFLAYYQFIMKESLDRYDRRLIEQAENEGMVVRTQSKPRRLLGFDELAIIRAEGEGMVDKRVHKNDQTLTPGVPVRGG